VFDLGRDVDAHAKSAAQTGERAIAGVTHGLMGLGDTVTWEARHFGVVQRMTVRIDRFDRPHEFEDARIGGALRSMRHVHHFRPHADGTLMVDDFAFEAPFGVVGAIVAILALRPYFEKFLRRRAEVLKGMAEAASSRTSP